MPELILASGSPRRRELLMQLGVPFEVVTSDVPEQPKTGESARDYALRLAHAKAGAVHALYPHKAVLGADTLVVLGDRILEKPSSKTDGIQMLMALSNQTHQVVTAVALCYQQHQQSAVVSTQVAFKPISHEEADVYWATGEPQDKAGGYAIQGKAAAWIKHIQGSYSNVVGLPLAETADLLEAFLGPLHRFWHRKTEGNSA
jgi:septum formation protein